MAEKLYFSDEECRRVGFSSAMVFTLRKLAEFVDAQTRIAESEAAIVVANDAIDAANTDIGVLNTAVNALDSRIDAYDALAPFVRQDQGAAWAAASGTASRATYATYAGQTVAGPTIAEVQAIDDHMVILSQRVKGLVDDLKGNGALT